MAAVNKTDSTRTYGFWYGKDVGSGLHGGKAQSDERVLYHLHGGGYVMGSGSPSGQTGSAIADYVTQCSGVLERAFCLNYRLASAAPLKAENPFPAPLIDTLAGYRYLVETLGFKANNIIVSGDSAGGHLALVLVRFLIREATAALPLRNARTDVQVNFESGYTARALYGSLPEGSAATNSWISPSSLRIDTQGAFSNFPPTFVLAGGAEQTLDAIKTLYNRLQNDNDPTKVKYVEYPGASHDFLMVPFHEPEKTEGAKEVARWLGTVFSTP